MIYPRVLNSKKNTMFEKIKIRKKLKKFLDNFNNQNKVSLNEISNNIYLDSPYIFGKILENYQKIEIEKYKINEIRKIENMYFADVSIEYLVKEKRRILKTNVVIRLTKNLINLNFINLLK